MTVSLQKKYILSQECFHFPPAATFLCDEYFYSSIQRLRLVGQCGPHRSHGNHSVFCVPVGAGKRQSNWERHHPNVPRRRVSARYRPLNYSL